LYAICNFTHAILLKSLNLIYFHLKTKKSWLRTFFRVISQPKSRDLIIYWFLYLKKFLLMKYRKTKSMVKLTWWKKTSTYRCTYLNIFLIPRKQTWIRLHALLAISLIIFLIIIHRHSRIKLLIHLLMLLMKLVKFRKSWIQI